VAAAAAAARALALARRSMDAGLLIPLLRQWRHVPGELDIESLEGVDPLDAAGDDGTALHHYLVPTGAS
jgi:hypothetical protein